MGPNMNEFTHQIHLQWRPLAVAEFDTKKTSVDAVRAFDNDMVGVPS